MSSRNLFNRSENLVLVRRGETLTFVRNGAPGFYVIESGVFVLSSVGEDRDCVLRVCGRGDWAGLGMWTRVPSQGHQQLTAIEEGAARFIERAEFTEAVNANPAMRDLAFESLERILAERDHRIRTLETSSLPDRVLLVLRELNRKFGCHTGEGWLISAKIDRRIIASLAGINPETLSRVLSRLVRARAIKRKGHRLLLTEC